MENFMATSLFSINPCSTNLLLLTEHTTNPSRPPARGSLLCRRGVHVEEDPPMAVWINETVRVHEAEILRLVAGRAARGKRFGDKTIHLFTALACMGEYYLNGLARIANGFGRELTKLSVRAQHNKNRFANNNASSIVTSELGIA